jgi:hypothetical protein
MYVVVARAKYAAPVLRCRLVTGGSSMGRSRFVAGALGIVAGFFVYQCGLFLALDHLEGSLVGLGLSSLSPTLFSLFGSPPIAGAVLQLIGGIVAIAGLLLCISSVGSQPRGKVPPELTAMSRPDTQVAASVRKCKYCGAAMEQDAAFCPKCERAQA